MFAPPASAVGMRSPGPGAGTWDGSRRRHLECKPPAWWLPSAVTLTTSSRRAGPGRGGPFRDQGVRAQQFIVPASSAATLPAPVAFDTAAGFPVPALTADQALRDGIGVSSGETVLVNGAGGVTGNLLAQFAALYGAKVVATASGQTAPRTETCGAALVLECRSPDWRAQVRDWTGGKGVDAAVNAVPADRELAAGP
jgi:NADPH:quinone reductase-like Zn-dependent oxidoreductase